MIVLCGPPACGKTEIGVLLSRKLKLSIVRTDDLRGARYRRLSTVAEGADVVEGTFYLPRHWATFLTLEEPIFVVLVICSRETALERNRLWENPIPERALDLIH